MSSMGATYHSPEIRNSMPHQQSFNGSADISTMARELKTVRAMLENQLSGLAWGQTEQNDPAKVNLIKRLVQLGIGWDLSQNLVNELPAINEQAWSKILRSIESKIPLEERDILEKGGIVALVGPTGVGKTTTIAKMASRFVMRNSPNDLALISTDCYKIGAQAQLKTFAELINVPVHVAKTQGELYALLTSLSNKKLILIDTAGMSQRDLQLAEQITSGHQGLTNVRNYLVMSAATQLSVMKDIVSSFSQIVLKGCILTKVDEALQLGNVLTVLIEEKLPIVYLSNGQRVPEDLESVRINELVDRAIVLGQQNTNNALNEQALRLGMGKEISDAQ
jgi:flagellar biosynthesis protein FlhF